MDASRPALIRHRLCNQRLVRTAFNRPDQVVAWLGAVQAQDYAGATWALGMRANGVAEADVHRAFNEGAILRTHVLRPTWHFLTPATIRWVLALSAPRVHRANAPYYRKFELDPRILARSRAVLERVLRDGAQLTRVELAGALRHAGIDAGGPRLAYLMMHAELEAVVCSGARRGKQFTYAWLDARVPRGRMLDRDEALAALAACYFASHGPATVRDFAWWSGLTVRDARTGLGLIARTLTAESIGDRTCWRAPSKGPAPASSRGATSVYLLPNYDEYLIAYKDRDLLFGPTIASRTGAPHPDPFPHHLIIDGTLVGSWRRTLKASSVLVDAIPYRPLTAGETRAVAAAADRLGRFMNLPASLRLGRAGQTRTGAL